MFKENKGMKLGVAVGAILAAAGGICYAVYKWEESNSRPEPNPNLLVNQSKES
jgi:hypothetical protein